MKITKAKVCLKAFFVALSGCMCFSLFANQRVWNVYPTEANTPAEAYDWTDEANWNDSSVAQDYDKAVFNYAKSRFFVKMPENIILSNITMRTSNNKYPCLIAGRLVLSSDPAAVRRADSEFGAAFFYGDIEVGTENDIADPYVANLNLAGRAIAKYRNWVPSYSWVSHRLDKFAYSSNPLRTDDIQIANSKAHNPGNASVAVYAPVGAEACTGRWNLSKGSPYASLAGEDHPVAVGTIVTGEYLPEGTFVRRVFPDSHLELSNPAIADASGAELSFAAFTPDVRINVTDFKRIGDGATWFSLYKYRPQDGLRYEMTQLHGYAPQTLNFGVAANLADEFYPGTHVLHKIVTSGGNMIFHNTDLELAGDDINPSQFSENVGVMVAESCTARITVTNNISGIINNFTDCAGTLVKAGAGSLAIAFSAVANNGSISVEGGTLTISKNASAPSGPIVLSKLMLASGSVIEIPEEGLCVSDLVAEEGAVIRGDGKLTVKSMSPDSINYVLEGETEVVYSPGMAGAVTTVLPEGGVVGHPVFWLDASKPATIEYTTNADGENCVTRWNDCREGEPMFCTNIFYSPVFVNGATMAEKYVNIRQRLTSTNDLTEALVWNVPVGGIKAVFLVHDPRDGGGEILGRTSRLSDSYFGTQGGPYYRGTSDQYGVAIINPNHATPCVKFGRFYLDGNPVCGYAHGYSNSGLQLVEHHVAEDQYTNNNTKRKELWIDAFGIGYRDRDRNGFGKNGCMRIAEYIIYTNSLTHVERLKVAQYLSRKWIGKDIYWDVAETNVLESAAKVKPVGQTLEIDEGKSFAVMSMTGPGEIRKEGEGSLFMGSVSDIDVTVAGGELVVRSLAVTNTIVPPGAWVHVDATEPSSIDFVVEDGVSYVSKWKSLTDGLCGYTPYEVEGRFDPFDPAIYREGAINGLPALDLGPLYHGGNKTPVKRALRYIKSDGTRYAKENYVPYTISPELETVFIVADSSQGGNSLLGSDMHGYPAVGFPHKVSLDFSTPIISCETYAWGYTSFSNHFEAGSAVFRTNGVPINANRVPFSGQADVFSFRSKACPARSDSLGIHAYANAVNGLMYGEVLIYEEALSSNQFMAVEAYLRKKWKGHSTPDFECARMKSLFLENGAAVSLCGYGMSSENPIGSLTVGSLGGDGSITGDVILEEGASLVVDVKADGIPSTVSITGSANVTGGGAVVFKGDIANVKLGSHPILTAGLLEFDGEWVCESPVKSLVFSIRAIDNAICFNVSKSATILFLR